MLSSCGNYSCVKLRMLIQMRLGYPLLAWICRNKQAVNLQFSSLSTFRPIFSFAGRKIKARIMYKTLLYNVCNLVIHLATTYLSFKVVYLFPILLGFGAAVGTTFYKSN